MHSVVVIVIASKRLQERFLSWIYSAEKLESRLPESYFYLSDLLRRLLIYGLACPTRVTRSRTKSPCHH
jgi:hypothetical protein